MLLKIANFDSKFQLVGQTKPSPNGTVAAKTQSVEAANADGGIKRFDDSYNISSFRLTDAFRDYKVNSTSPVNREVAAPMVSQEVEGRDPFDAENIYDAISMFCDSNRIDNGVAIAMRMHHPIVSENLVTLYVDNALQQEKLNQMLLQLKNHLRRQLNNGAIELEISLFDASNTQEAPRYFTSNEKFQYFMQKNTAVDYLRKKFCLELE